jgi:Cd2+/Zn2+-exporting ATPase
VNRPKKTLPVLGQAPQEPEGSPDYPAGCTEDCCQNPEVAQTPVVAVRTREGNPERGAAPGRLEKTVVRVEGMDCASCAATVEKRVGRLLGVRSATVNFAAGRLDAEHDPGLAREEIEDAVRSAGYGVAGVEEAERPRFWRTPRVLSVFASAVLFALGLALTLAGRPRSRGSRPTSRRSRSAGFRSFGRP